jgi:hypothetical protein
MWLCSLETVVLEGLYERLDRRFTGGALTINILTAGIAITAFFCSSMPFVQFYGIVFSVLS